MSTHRLCLSGAFAFTAVIAFSVIGCSSTPGVDTPDPEGPEAENIGVSQEAVCGTSSVDWSAFPEGNGTQQCVHGVIVFYQNKFGVTPPAASGGPIGNCAHYGACNIWVNPANQPNPAVWNKYAWGSATPQAYDMVVFPPTASNAYGHIASVDHYAAGKLWQMDSNWSPWKGIKAACVHDVGSYVPYGFYRLKSLEGTAPAAPPASTSCHRTAGELTFTCDGTAALPAGQTCVNISEPGDPGTWTDNYLCSTRDLGLKWSSSGAIAGMACTQVGESAGGYADAWKDDYLCAPVQSPYAFSYSSAGPIAGKTCVNLDEPDAKSWDDNYVCTDPVWNYSAGGFTFASHGTVTGQTCVATTESADPGWEDNFFCHAKDLGMKWSEAGPIDGMTCVNVKQPDEKTADLWKDNYLCVPKDSEYTFTWSTTGPIADQACVRWYDQAQTSTTSLSHFMCVHGPGTDVPTPIGGASGNAPAAGDPASDGDAPAAASGCSASSSSSTSTRNAGAAIALIVLIGTVVLTRRGRLGRRL